MIRTDIKNNLVNGLANMTEANGYNLNYNSNNINFGFRSANTVKSFPYVCVIFGLERNTSFESNDYEVPIVQLDVLLLVYNNDTNYETNEKIIHDVYSYFKPEINDDVTVTTTLKSISNVIEFEIDEILPYTNRVRSLSVVGLHLKVTYVDTIEISDIESIITQIEEYVMSQRDEYIVTQNSET